MKIKPLIQLRELIAAALKSQTNLSKSFNLSSRKPWNFFLPYRIASTFSKWRGSDIRLNSASA